MGVLMSLLLLLMFSLIIGSVILVIGYACWQWLFGGKEANESYEAKEKKRAQWIEAKGWRYDAMPGEGVTYRVLGTSPGGLDWKVDYDKNSSSDHPPELVFLVDSLRGPGHEWRIVYRAAFDMTRKGFGRAVVGGVTAIAGALSKRFANEAEFFLEAGERSAGTAALRERFVFIAASARYDHILDADIEARILVWPHIKQPSSVHDSSLDIGLGPQGLRIKLEVIDPSVEVIEHLIRLGEALADSTRWHRGAF